MMSVLVTLILGLLSLYLFIVLTKRTVQLYKLSWIPGPPALPILGNYFMMTSPENVFKNMHKYYKRYGKTYKLWIGTSPIIYCQDREIIEQVFKQEDKVCRPPLYHLVSQFLGPGLLFGEGGEKWRAHRKSANESFHMDVLEKNSILTVKKINKLIQILDRVVEKSEPIDIITYMKQCFLDINVGFTTGFESEALEKPESNQFVDAIESMSEIVMARMVSPVLKFSFFFTLSPLKKIDEETKKIMSLFVKKVVSHRRLLNSENHHESGNKRILADVMLAMENKNELFSPADVEHQVSNFIMASYDTISTATSYLLFILGNHPKIQEDVQKEIDSVVPNILQDGVTPKDINNLKLLDRCVKETLRMFPAAPIIGRHLLQPFKTSKGTLPAGVDLYVSLYSYHRDAAVFPNPDTFDPDRFLPENADNRHPFSWMPFGLGPRICIGQKVALMQSKIAVAMMLKKYSVRSYERIEDLNLVANVVIKSLNGIRVYLSPRNN